MTASREIHLAARPQGAPRPEDFSLVEVDVPDPGDGQVLIRNAYMSVDPYMRGRMNDAKSYTPPFQLGQALTGGAVGQVVASRNDRLAEGTWVVHDLGWRELALSDGKHLRPFDPSLAPVSTTLGVLGMPGLTAYFGLLELGRPVEGETVFVSGAAGAVGSVAGPDREAEGMPRDRQRRLGGRRRPGSRSSASTRSSTTHETDTKEALRDGIDVYFDNVGGSTLEAALARVAPARPHRRLRRDLAVQRLRRRRRARATSSSSSRSACGWRASSSPTTTTSFPAFSADMGAWLRDGSDALPRDGGGGDRERPVGVHRPAGGGEHRQDARESRSGAVNWRCRLFGHRVPKARWFFLTERFQRCERCGARVQSK